MSAMCVQTWFRKWRSWEMMIMVELRSLSMSSSQRMVLMSRLLVGSSSSRMSGFENNACASKTRSFQIGGFHVVVVSGFRIGVNRIALDHRGPHLGMAHHHDIQHAHFFVGKLILAQLTQTFVGIQADIACRWFEIAAEDFHERRLAATIGADQAIAVAVAELDGNVFKQRLRAELHRDVCCG